MNLLPSLVVALSAFSRVSAAASLPPTLSAAPYWFKIYSTAPYKETWTAEVGVSNFKRDFPKALRAIEKAGGKLTQPVENFVSSKKDEVQQLSFTIPLKDAQSLLKSLRKLGDLTTPVVRSSGVPIPVDEVKRKIDLLMKEKTEHAAELAKVPASAAATEEILEHLFLVEEVAKSSSVDVLFDLQVKRK